MTRDEFAKMLDRMAVAWTSRAYRTVVEHFSDDLFYCDPLNYSFDNKAALLNFFENDDKMPQHCVFHNAVFDEERQLGTAEYTYRGTNQYHGTVWIKMKSEKIQSWREYQHRSAIEFDEFWRREPSK